MRVAFRLVCETSRHPAFFVSAVINGATAKREGLMEKPYTHTTWRVRAGSEDEFVKRWSEWVDWSHREGLEAPALLLRDLENPQAFISFGPWANTAAVRSWRALAGYQERVARLSEVLDSFEPRTLEIVARR
jgi:heme-degrading monooxygenase HmoA